MFFALFIFFLNLFINSLFLIEESSKVIKMNIKSKNNILDIIYKFLSISINKVIIYKHMMSKNIYQ